MAQPGHNSVDRQALAPHEELVYCWLAQLEGAPGAFTQLADYIEWWGETVVPLVGRDRGEFERARARLSDREAFAEVLEGLCSRHGIYETPSWREIDGGVEVVAALRAERVERELGLLEAHGFAVIVSLVETAPHAALEAAALTTHHLPVRDSTPPLRQQVEAFAEILEQARRDRARLVVHCMAGIGRTSTMLMASGLLLGRKLSELQAMVRSGRPNFVFGGPQWRFVQDLARELDAE
ncbi:MAG: dual specificity protein phosphatase family protein [Myxococcales bacterium]|nr:dual specificity protein phosphatase family protein [Myxococcales bacterium]